MMRQSRRSATLGCGVALLTLGGLWLGLASCSVPTPIPIFPPAQNTSDVPSLGIIEPTGNLTVGKGDRFVIRWIDSDRDDNARISFSMVDSTTNQSFTLVQAIEENDATGPDSFSVSTLLIPEGRYFLQGTINDGNNPAQETFATLANAPGTNLEITVTPPGQGPPTVPPVVAVTQPAFNLSVAQDDVLVVTVQPSALFDPVENRPYDPDSEVTLFLLLDADTDPTNDDPGNPIDDANGNPIIIVLDEVIVPEGQFEPIEFRVLIDLEDIPQRPDGEAYFIRVTIDDKNNPAVHAYAAGTISVVQLAAGPQAVDLFDIGRTLSGARFYGFNPSANLGSSISRLGDFDADGVDDFVMVAQFGNPQNSGPVGEGYLIYGLDNGRFGDSLAINGVSKSISGAVFPGPDFIDLDEFERPLTLGDGLKPAGITDVAPMPDISGDGRPEIIFGMAAALDARDGMDWDPADEDVLAGGGEVRVVVELWHLGGTIDYSDVPFAPNEGPFGYSSRADVTLSSSMPNADLSGNTTMSVVDLGPGNREWILLRFSDILGFRDEFAESGMPNLDVDVMAKIVLRVTDPSMQQASVFRLLMDFEEGETLSSFTGGGEPRVGIDYDDGAFAMVGAPTLGEVEIDVSNEFRQMFEGAEDEISLMFAPNGADRLAFRSGEGNPSERPRLILGYTRLDELNPIGCYPDNFVNNSGDLEDDAYDNVHSGGMAAVVYSENRDSAGTIRTDRLDNTSVPLEFVGQAALLGMLADTSLTEMDALGFDPAEEDRIAGFRVIGGGYDDIDARMLNQGPRLDSFGYNVSSIGDINNDGVDEIIFSAPTNERYLRNLQEQLGFASTHDTSTYFRGSLVIKLGENYNNIFYRDLGVVGSTATIPMLDHHVSPPFGNCISPPGFRGMEDLFGTIQVYAETEDDFLYGGQSAGDFNLDGVGDILAGAPLNDRSTELVDSGAVYILYGRPIVGDFFLDRAEDPVLRAPMLRIRGLNPGDKIGFSQSTGLDVNGDRIDDVFFSSPRADFGGVNRTTCGNDFDGDGDVDSADLSTGNFTTCRTRTGPYVFSDDRCKAYDLDFDTDIDDDDRTVLDCLIIGRTDCCDNLVENGFVGVIFGGVYLDGDRDITQLATSELAGAVFFGSETGHRAGYDVSSAGDFNQDGFGDVLISAPGEVRLDSAARERLGVVYLVFGGTHLNNRKWNLSQVGSADLPGMVFISPYVKGRPNEAAPTTVAFIGDINNDGFGDIAIGNPRADFIDLAFPQGPNAPGTDAEVGRRSDAGDCYVIYGNNFGSNRGN